MKQNLFKSLFFMLAAFLLVLGSCTKETVEPEDKTTPTNNLLGYWHGGGNYFGGNVNLEFKETTMTISDYSNSQSEYYTVEYGDNKITVNEVGTNDPGVLTYSISGNSVTFTDEDNDSFTLEKGKGSTGGSGGGGSGGGGSSPKYKVTITDYTLKNCSKYGIREFNIETENKERAGTGNFFWQTVDEELDVPDDLPDNPWAVTDEPNMSYAEIKVGGVFNIRLNYNGSVDDISLGDKDLKMSDFYDSRPSQITIVQPLAPYTWTLILDLDWEEE